MFWHQIQCEDGTNVFQVRQVLTNIRETLSRHSAKDIELLSPEA